MEASDILENSFIRINKNFNFYKNNYSHQYYLNIDDAETSFIDKYFKKISAEMKPQDKMLSFSISSMYTATAILAEIRVTHL